VIAAARWQECAKQLEKPSPPCREIGGERNRIIGDREVGGKAKGWYRGLQ
jgi:hypothetical protein